MKDNALLEGNELYMISRGDEEIEIKVGVDNVVDAIENINYLRELIKNKNINKED